MAFGRIWMALKVEPRAFDSPAAIWRVALKVGFRAVILGCLSALVILPALYWVGLLQSPLVEVVTLTVVLSWLFAGVMSGACALSMGEMIRDLAQSRAEFERLSRTDTLSGLANRRAFNEALAEAYEDASLAILDVDRFKAINDRFGHQAGDEVIRDVAGILRGVVGDRGLVARLGGEEFGLILTGGGLPQRLALVERARNMVSAQNLRAAGVGLTVTVSAGVAEFYPGQRSELVYARADRALYQAKDEGRNRVVHEQSLPLSERDLARSPQGDDLVFGGM